MKTYYFHGTPGSKAELSLFGPSPAQEWHVPMRSGYRDRQGFILWLDRIAEEIRAAGVTDRIRIVGFSIGAFVAIEIASRLGQTNARMELVSPAGPLQDCVAVSDLAGHSVFDLAAKHPRTFGALVQAQAIMARTAPGMLMGALFASAGGMDKDLAEDIGFKKTMRENVQIGLGAYPRTYQAEILSYVADWRTRIELIQMPVRLWHGNEDNWATPDMSESLARRLIHVESIERIPGASHYSTLRHAIRILD